MMKTKKRTDWLECSYCGAAKTSDWKWEKFCDACRKRVMHRGGQIKGKRNPRLEIMGPAKPPRQASLI